ncbi:hypothetical protein F5051DRAFT_435618 [Lentinula edodes]|nr:hypothetical protein F5051DRAFT_435618 [Lentinula edodes]
MTTVSASSPMITYSQHWSLNNGSMATNNAGATANVTFNGTFVQVFGTIPALKHDTPEPASSYILDDTSPIQFNAARFGETDEVSNFAFYQSNLDLASGNHSLVITSLTNGADFILDSIVFSSNPTATSPTNASESLNPPSSSLLSSSSSPLSLPPLLSEGRSNVGIIVGCIVVGALILVGVIVTCFLLLVRRRRRTNHFRTTLQPFLVERNLSSSSHAIKNDTFGVVTHLPSPSTPSVIITLHSGPPPSYYTN